VSESHLAWTHAGVAVFGTFVGRDTETGLAYVTTRAGRIGFSPPADLRRQLADVAPGTWITITHSGEHDDRKMFEVTTARADVPSPRLNVPKA
jgi:hypothetical protein